MKSFLAAAAAVLVLASGCITKENTTDANFGAPEFTQTYTLQGRVADAVTGVPLGAQDLKLSLVVGDQVRGPTRLNTDASSALNGEYAFSGIPLDANAANKTYELWATKPNYRVFRALVSRTATIGSNMDTVYSRVADIYLFPIGTAAPDYRFTVTYNGKPVPNATVLFDPIAAGDSATHSGTVLANTTGAIAALSATTDAAGKVTFAGSALALGAAYRVEVLPVSFAETASGVAVPLARLIGGTLVVGFDATENVLALSDLMPGAPLFIASASNAQAGQVTAAGTLVVRFNLPVTITNLNRFTAVYVAGNAADGSPGLSVLSATDPVLASLSADGLTLTLTPTFTTPPLATDKNVSILYSAGTSEVVPRDYPAQSWDLFTLSTANGTQLSGLVVLAGP